MAIDTSIYGMIERPKVKSPQEFQAEAYTLRNLGQESELRSQQIATAKALEQQRVADLQSEQDFQRKLGQGVPDQELYATNATLAGKYFENKAKVAKEQQQLRVAELDARTKDLEGRIKQSGYISQLAKAGTASPMAASRTLMQAVQEGLLDETQANQLLALPWEQQKQELEVFVKAGMSTQAQAEEEYKKLAEERAAAEFKATLPGKVADSQGKQMTLEERKKYDGMTASEKAKFDADRADAAQRAADAAAGRAVTMRGQNMADARTRELTEVTRGNKPLTEAESKTYGYFGRAKQSNEILDQLETTIANKGTVGQAVLRNAPNILQSEDNQAYLQAERQFIEAYLRRDSGAAISQSEYDNARKTFFAQTGDGKAVLDQKKKARQEVIRSLEVGSGRAIERNGGTPTSGTSTVSTKQEELRKKYNY